MILSGMFACVSGDFAAGQFLCQPDAAEPCPPGLDCIDGICQEPGSAQAGHGGESLGGGGTGPGGGGDGGQAGHGGHAGAGGQGGAGGAPPTPPSCVGLADDCGPQQATDCCAGVVVTGSTFDRSNDDGAEATVSDYRLDWYEVTVGRFRKFVDANLGTEASPPADGAGAHPLIADSGWSSPWNGGLPADTTALKTSLECQAHFTWTDSPGGNETRPINCVSWQLAFAFCAWDEGRLPTEAEWNHAAAAGDKQRLYPWGNDFDASYAAYQCMGDGSGGCAATDILTVGSLTVGYGEWGHADLAGNMWEWVFDGYVDPYPTPCSDCASLTPHNDRVFRGGGYKSSATSSLRTSTRFYQWPGGQSDDVGFRCARQP